MSDYDDDSEFVSDFGRSVGNVHRAHKTTTRESLRVQNVSTRRARRRYRVREAGRGRKQGARARVVSDRTVGTYLKHPRQGKRKCFERYWQG